MQNFDDIRPYNDAEVAPVVARLIANKALHAAYIKWRFGDWPEWARKILQPFAGVAMRYRFGGIKTVLEFQSHVEQFLIRMLETTSSGLSVYGVDSLKADKAYLFLSNHRDITLDPALANMALYQNGLDTLRIAIGDNLLTLDFASDLMRINKSFIVKRSASGPRQMLAAYKQLSSYIRHSVSVDNHSVWMAQREGRAKDGNDVTQPAIIKMLTISQNRKAETFQQVVKELNIVPMAISYEYDPCDLAKANELYTIATAGEYVKAEQEDMASIAAGFVGHKGHIHISFGKTIEGDFETPEEVAAEVDRQVIANYALYPCNVVAYQMLHGSVPQGMRLFDGSIWDPVKYKTEQAVFEARLAQCPTEQRDYFLNIYANCIVRKLELNVLN